jgi:glycosyltransferase involved in cell wall biosynthesis
MNHLALLIPGLDRIGGAEQQVLLLAKGLRARGWRVSVLALTGTGGTAAQALRTAGIFFHSFHMRKGVADPRGWLGLHRWLERERPDVLHAHLPHATWMARWARLASPWLRVVDTLHSTATGGLDRHIGYRISNWLTDQVTAVSEAVAETHQRQKLVQKEKLRIVPNGIDTTCFRPDAEVRARVRTRLGFGEEFVWFASGRLEAVKDYPNLLEAFAQLDRPARLLIAGDGPQWTDLQSLATQRGIQEKIVFLGFTEDVLPYLQAADAYVLASKWEGLPMGILEAAACALPTVATDVPGSRHAVEHGRTGFLAPACSSASLSETMGRLMSLSATQRHTMGRNGRRSIAERYSLERVLDCWEEVYRRQAPAMRKPPASVRDTEWQRQRIAR